MNRLKLQYLIAALLAAALLGTAAAAADDPPGPEVEATGTPTRTPLPSPTPRLIRVELYFRRTARIIPIYRPGEEPAIPVADFEIAQEVPWLTEEDLGGISYPREDAPRALRLHLGPKARWKYGEAMMGNVGRTILLVIDGTVRATAEMVPVARKDRIDFSGIFFAGELDRIQAQIAFRPPPTPTPAPSPTPAVRKRFIVK